jgi:type IV pilus assembly protein PilA
VIRVKTNFQLKFLQALKAKSQNNGGFTLVELLIVVVVIGILAAIALPSFLNQTAAAKQTEATQNVRAIIWAQQLWRTKNSTFADNFDQLALGVVKGNTTDSTTVYTYTMSVDNSPLAGTMGLATVTAAPQDNRLRAYSGSIEIANNAVGLTVWERVFCESTTPGAASAAPTNGNSCPSGYTALQVAGK